MESSARCETCTFYYHMKTECRINPPVIITTLINQQSGKVNAISGWPGTKPELWCGKYTRDVGDALAPAAS